MPRLTIRRLMIAVAVVAVLLAAFVLVNERRKRFALLANDHGLKAIEEVKAKRPGRHYQLWEKYRYAAHHPWLPVEADPPE
jgi:hypothetical protein